MSQELKPEQNFSEEIKVAQKLISLGARGLYVRSLNYKGGPRKVFTTNLHGAGRKIGFYDPKLETLLKPIFEASQSSTSQKDTEGSTAGPAQPLLADAISQAKGRLVDKISAQFDMVMEKVFLDDYRRALFATWKARHKYQGDLGDFVIDAIDNFFEERGVDFEYVERTSVIRR